MRKIIHVDCDCFYAAVEVRDQPRLRGLPVAVGGRPGGRGVIATCNYEARAFGVRSAMPAARALRLCPDLVILPPDMARYRQVASDIHGIFRRYTERIEPLSLDEAYLDVSDSEAFQGSATRIAEAIRAAVRAEVGITVSAGVAPGKVLAKLASEWRKPDGLFVIRPEAVADFIAALPVSRLHGVGEVTGRRLAALGIHTGADLRRCELTELVRHFGRFGQRLHELARGVDERPVRTRQQRKSISVETTYASDLPDLDSCRQQLASLQERLQERWQRAGQPAPAGQVLKMRFNDFRHTTVESSSAGIDTALWDELCARAWERGRRPVRLLGLGLRLANPPPRDQLGLFPEAG